MDLKRFSPRLRLIGLAAVALVLSILLVRRLTAPTPVFAGADSTADRCHLIPNDSNHLVIFDPRNHQLLTFVVVNGTDLRLQGWRDTTHDPRLWDTSLLKPIPAYSALETKDGASTQYLRSANNDPRVGSMIAAMEAEMRKRQLKFEGIAGEITSSVVPANR